MTVAARALRGQSHPGIDIAILLATTAVALIAATAMLLGQLGPGPRWVTAGFFGVLSVGAVVLSIVLSAAPTTVFFALPTGQAEAPSLAQCLNRPLLEEATSRLCGELTPLPAALTGLALLLALGIGSVVAAPRVTARLRYQTLRDHAVRLGAVSALALTGDLRIASARLGAPVRVGRFWAWRMPAGLTRAIVVRDLVGIARTPARSLAAGACVLGAGLLLGSLDLALLGPAGAAAAGATAVLLSYASIGPWCRGLRAAAETVGGFGLTPLSPRALLVRHFVVPGILSVSLISGGAGAVAALGGLLREGSVAPLHLATATAAGAVTAAVALLLRLSGALKGPLPQGLLAPVPTPVGDMAGVNVLVWSLDGVLVAALIGGVLAAVTAASLGAGAICAALALALLAAWARSRLRLQR